MKGIIDIPGAKAKAGKKGKARTAPASARTTLDNALASVNTVLCLVFGESADADTVSAAAEGLASTSSDCEAVQVVRIRDPGILKPAEAAAWRPRGDELVTLLTFARRVSKRLPAADARATGLLLIALVRAAAGDVA